MKRLFLATVLALPTAWPWSAWAAEPPAAPFPSPFLAEHQVVETDGRGGEWRTEPVTDYYGGSLLVSVRADGGRTIVDFAKREITEVQPRGTYWTLPFSRIAELKERLRRAETSGARREEVGRSQGASRVAGERSKPIRVEDVRGGSTDARSGARGAEGSAGARHLRASVEGGTRSVDVWVDAEVRLSREARAALRSFEKEALGPVDGGAEASHSELVAAVRDHVDGAFAVRTRRANGRDGAGEVEDVVSKLTPIAAIPPKVIAIPTTYRRVPSPLEAMVAFVEEEAARRSGAAPTGDAR